MVEIVVMVVMIAGIAVNYENPVKRDHDVAVIPRAVINYLRLQNIFIRPNLALLRCKMTRLARGSAPRYLDYLPSLTPCFILSNLTSQGGLYKRSHIRMYFFAKPQSVFNISAECPFKCEQCGATFRHMEYLEKHKRGHSSELNVSLPKTKLNFRRHSCKTSFRM